MLVLDLNFIVGAERAENRVDRVLQKNDGAEQSAEQEVMGREWSGGYRNRLERGLAFLLLTLRSHSLA